MKLKNIILIFSVLLAFASCSKNDETEAPQTGKTGRVSVKVEAVGGLATRAADKNELPGEAAINNLTAIVFNENGTQVLGSKWQSTVGADGTAEITDVEMQTGNVQIAIVANVPQGSFEDINNYTAFENKIVELSSQLQSNLTMSSQLISVILSDTDDNYIGYGTSQTNVGGLNDPILLTRVAGRVDVVSIRTNFSGSILSGRTVRVNNIWLSKVKTASRYFSAVDWGVVEIPGYFSDEVARNTLNRIVNAETPITDTSYYAYIMENGASENATRLVIDATLQASGDYLSERKQFFVTINENGKDRGYNHNYIKRNYVYQIGITFGRNSFDGDQYPTPPTPSTPVDITLDCVVSIANWGNIRQEASYE